MIRNSKLKIGMFLLIGIFLISLVSATYSVSNPQYTQFGGAGSFGQSSLRFDDSMCQQGQDFVIQIAPLGCEPAPVRSDLLEEQNVPVYCQLSATKINPLIDVKAIDGISIIGDYPPEVSGIGFQPARAALGVKQVELTSVMQNIGYAVIVLKQQPNESALENCESGPGGDICYVEGALRTNIKYDVKNAFGIGKVTHILPVLDEGDFEDKKTQYSFWNAKGYLRAEEVSGDFARISVYDGQRKVKSVELKKGKTSEKIYLPGFQCLSSLEVRLDSLKDPNTRAKLKVGDDYVELERGSSFLDGRCTVRDVSKNGVTEEVSIACREDDLNGRFKNNKFDLKIVPRIRISVDGQPEKIYSVGDKLKDSGDRSIYIGYVGKSPEGKLFIVPVNSTAKTSGEFKNKTIYTTMLPAEISSADWTSGNILVDALAGFARFGVRIGVKVTTGDYPMGFIYMDSKNNKAWKGYKLEENIKLLDYADAVDEKLVDFDTSDVKNNYDLANDDYDTLIDSFGGIKSADTTYGEKALLQKIDLANKLNQKKTAIKLCSDFNEKYPESTLADVKCSDTQSSSIESATSNVKVNGKTKSISLVGVEEPGKEDYSAEVIINSPALKDGPFVKTMMKGVKYTLNGSEYVELKEVGEDYAILSFKVDKDLKKRISSADFSTRVKLGSFESGIGINKYRVDLNKVNLKKVAKVTLIPGIQNVGSETNFSFKIGIEKRAIQLTPDQINSRISDLDEKIEKWSGREEKVGDAVELFQDACLIGGGVLILKNFLSNLGGKGAARKDVMKKVRSDCQKIVNAGNNPKMDTMTKCYNEKGPDIEKSVNALTKIQDDQTKDIRGRETAKKEGILGESRVDTDEATAATKKALQEGGGHLTQGSIKEIEDKNLRDSLNETAQNLKNKPDSYSHSQLIQIEKNMEMLRSEDETLRRMAEENLASISGEINSDAKSVSGSTSKFLTFVKTDKTKSIAYGGGTGKQFTGIDGIGEDDLVHKVSVDNEEYTVVLNKPINGKMGIERVYDSKGIKLDNVPDSIGVLSFEKVDSSSYKGNAMSVRQVKYFETAPYQGLPSFVPVDVKNGWYANIKPKVSAGTGIRAFEDSGRVGSFELCNVGTDGSVDSRDKCMLVNLGTGQPYSVVPGLSEAEARKLISDAVKAIEQASKQHGAGVTQVTILGEIMKVGSPAAAIAGVECQDFMSPQDCKLLYNLCDPVMCPPSRCNLGGEYPVAEPMQTGIIGGIALCLPNFKEGVIVPVCLTGIQAGIQNLISVLNSSRDCLQDSLDTGRVMGICDEMQSISLCEIFWREGRVLADVLPKLIGAATGKNAARGGGEYLSLQKSWKDSKDTLSFFTQTYASTATRAFKARATEEIGSAICSNFASAVFPELDSLSSLVEPEFPPQYTARFSEIPFTTRTNPPTSQYNVYWHIFAGQGASGSYKVYLKGSSESSFFQDTAGSRMIDQGYLSSGETIDDTAKFTAPSGYKQLCVNVNGQEDCGFKEVSTSFVADFVTDKYVQEQASQTDIGSEDECISGSVSAYGLLGPVAGSAGAPGILNTNYQEGATEAFNPSIYDRGIIRVCSTDNPAIGTDPLIGTNRSRWQQVGKCSGNQKCWLDTSRIGDITEFNNIGDSILEDVARNTLNISKSEGNYVSETDFKSELERVGKLTDTTNKIASIKKLLDKTFFDYQKAELYSLRGDVYVGIAEAFFEKELLKRKEATDKKPSDPVDDDLPIDDRLGSPGFEDGLNDAMDEFKDQNRYGFEDEYTKGWDSYVESFDFELDEDERKILDEVESISHCDKCGGGVWNLCDETECNAISDKIQNEINEKAMCKFRRIAHREPCYSAPVTDGEDIVAPKVTIVETLDDSNRAGYDSALYLASINTLNVNDYRFRTKNYDIFDASYNSVYTEAGRAGGTKMMSSNPTNVFLAVNLDDDNAPLSLLSIPLGKTIKDLNKDDIGNSFSQSKFANIEIADSVTEYVTSLTLTTKTLKENLGSLHNNILSLKQGRKDSLEDAPFEQIIIPGTYAQIDIELSLKGINDISVSDYVGSSSGYLFYTINFASTVPPRPSNSGVLRVNTNDMTDELSILPKEYYPSLGSFGSKISAGRFSNIEISWTGLVGDDLIVSDLNRLGGLLNQLKRDEVPDKYDAFFNKFNLLNEYNVLYPSTRATLDIGLEESVILNFEVKFLTKIENYYFYTAEYGATKGILRIDSKERGEEVSFAKDATPGNFVEQLIDGEFHDIKIVGTWSIFTLGRDDNLITTDLKDSSWGREVIERMDTGK